MIRNAMKRLIANLPLTLFVLAVSLVLAEFAVRILLPAYDPSGLVRFVTGDGDQPTLGPKATVVRHVDPSGDFDVEMRFNGYGLRDARDLARADADDWFLVGDSYSMGHGVEATERFGELLVQRLGRDIFNVAIPGDFNNYGRLIHYARGFNAPVEKVIFGICMENDLYRYSQATTESRASGTQGASLTVRTKQALKAHSALYVYATTMLRRSPWLHELTVDAGLAGTPHDGLVAGDFDQQVIDDSLKRLEEISVGIERRVILIVPSRGLWLDGYRELADRYHRAFVDGARRRGFEVVDPRAALEAGGEPLRYHFAHDPHWTDDGHRLVARVLGDYLLEHPD